MDVAAETEFEDKQQLNRATILRVYNYYRLIIAFGFLYLFIDPNLTDFVGRINPDLFLNTIIFYIVVNAMIAVGTLLIREGYLVNTPVLFALLTGDIICMTLLMSASGGVSSGLGNFMIFTLAFGGTLIIGRVSTALPAIAIILTIYDEFYLFFLDENDLQSFFNAGLLGIVYFVSNILFQTLSQQIRNRETQVYTLEQLNQLIIDRMKIGVVVMSENEAPKMLNDAAEAQLYETVEGTTREALPEVLVTTAREWRRQQVNESAHVVPYSAGPELIASFSTFETPDEGIDTLVFLEDASEVQRQAQQLKLAAVGRLSASIAHEIRNPLGAISHAVQLLGESENLDKGDQRLCEIIQNHCVRMNDVIENVLQLSRRKTAEPRNIPLAPWLDDFMEEFTAAFPDTPDIDVSLQNEGARVAADPSHLSQILGNLCQNGIRYSVKETGEPKLQIAGGMDAQARPYLEVIDYGPGVPEDDVHNLFEPFFTTETTGTGLGLYLSRELAQANNVRLAYSKAATGGSSFRLTFLADPLD